MAVLSSGLVDIQAWGHAAPRGVLPKWWRWVMLLILVYSSTISVLTGQARCYSLASGHASRAAVCRAAACALAEPYRNRTALRRAARAARLPARLSDTSHDFVADGRLRWLARAVLTRCLAGDVRAGVFVNCS